MGGKIAKNPPAAVAHQEGAEQEGSVGGNGGRRRRRRRRPRSSDEWRRLGLENPPMSLFLLSPFSSSSFFSYTIKNARTLHRVITEFVY